MLIIKSGIVAVGISCALLVGACTSKPILNVKDAQISTGKSLQMSEVRKAIGIAGASLGWQIADVKPGLAQGTLNLRDHTAVVEIPYTATSYGIVYKSSVNLGEKDGEIHRNYNGWIQFLDNSIKAELARL